ncbi:MAG: mechanosensitive ion channel family protein [Myxococcales bacterium]|nr:mechanosensitive ion channel family protein [Myxococcales bacterium]
MSLAWRDAIPPATVAALLVGSFVLGHLLAAIARPLLVRVARRSAWEWDDALIGSLAAPAGVLVASRALTAATTWLDLDAAGRRMVERTAMGLTTALVLWAGFRAVDVVVAALGRRPWAADRPATRSLLAIAGRAAKAVFAAMAAIVVLADLGVSVASLIAGLGIGGLALALASQKTVENLFGTLSIGIDQPLREGDFVRAAGFLGTVETIGLRSTRLRTLDRTLVTIPNGQLADQHIEQFSVRDRIRLALTVGLEYRTTADQLRAVLDGLEACLRAHPRLWPDAVVVRLQGFGASSLDIEVMAWFQTSDWSEFQAIRQDVLIGFMRVIEACGTALAFPTQTINLARPAP